ncbi:NitT/TauT family transport system permease protein [Herbaspirillum sp. Sphag1AN]|uniref:ABC transporter permease n=1 Tax=unclassified Herbaspirillum TaxID=2624150 RepID=UPI0016161862|nr:MULTISPECIES: ABC transporter permease [unclassified Herbaspirillum]MBB3211848.1 NitT/TauT family transport system permease protein [Herbaspirillum sp. Sphag1AN]MBB3244318.1 NitT/TauT family transport system permease protein [Herbaspirillum sp. Sphag64]
MALSSSFDTSRAASSSIVATRLATLQPLVTVLRQWRRHGLRLASIVLCLLLWQWASSRHVNLGLISFQNVPSPEEVLQAAWTLLHSPKLLLHLGASLSRVFSGFVAAALAGIVLGLLIGRLPLVADLLLPPLELLRPIPAVAWIPLAILMFPSSEMSMIYITFIGALFPILLNTIHGVEGVDARLIASARSLGSGRRAVFTEVILPAASPSIVTGLSIGMGSAWFCLVTAEMIAGQFGIGYYTWASYTIQNYADIIVGMLFIGIMGMSSSALIKAFGKRCMPWYRPQA